MKQRLYDFVPFSQPSQNRGKKGSPSALLPSSRLTSTSSTTPDRLPLSRPKNPSLTFYPLFTPPPPNRARNATSALQKRLAHRNPNVQLFALEVRSLPSPSLRELPPFDLESRAEPSFLRPCSSPTPYPRTVAPTSIRRSLRNPSQRDWNA